MNPTQFVIRMIRSVESPEVARCFTKEHTNVLKQIGVNVTSAKQDWQSNPNTYMFIAEVAETGEMVAGMRLDMDSEIKPIPMAEALTKLSPEFGDIVDNLKSCGLAEGCGWWIKKGYSGLGLPGTLLRAGVSVAPRLGIHYIVGFPHQHTKPIMAKYGFIAVDVIGTNGSFMYPDERYNSTVVELNTQTLHTTPKVERERILRLRNNPQLMEQDGDLLFQYWLDPEYESKSMPALLRALEEVEESEEPVLVYANYSNN
ncbi:MAG: hypothetical protein KDC93_01545 [Cyclobacteriaceae bacterium]|nr:hypothetical protein [Cyclobacteriaceae bacterium]